MGLGEHHQFHFEPYELHWRPRFLLPDVGITLNSLYINPQQLFQLPLWQDMRKEGHPTQGFCVVAGIPSTDKAAEIIEGLRYAGIKHVAFKPG
jgi:fatty acid synthase subunit beta